MEDALRRHAEANTPTWLLRGPIESAATALRATRRTAALWRVRVGEGIERAVAARCEAECPLSRRTTLEPAEAATASRLYFDAYAAALWTSAHAEYVAALDAGIEEPAEPSVGSVPCASSAVDLSDLFARRANPRDSGVPKEAESLVQLLARCTNPGARGWDTVLQSALETSGTRTLLHDMIKICLTGMHPQLHPSARPSWQRRVSILRVAQSLLGDRQDLVQAACQVKDAVRRALASMFACDAASHAALSSLGHPVRHLHQPPMQLPHVGMEAAMSAFARAGAVLTTEEGSDRKLSQTLKRSFGTADASTVDSASPALVWDQSWLGRGTANVHMRQSVVTLASDVWTASFKAHFVAFWLFAQSHQLRVTRLDNVQHEAVHGLNAATRLVSLLDEEAALSAQRAALADPSSGILTIAEAATKLGLEEPPLATAPNGGARTPAEAVQLLASCGPEAAAKLLCYARAAWLCEELLTVDLGDRTASLQRAALVARYRTDGVDSLPMHATHICACTECHRVANAHVTAPGTVAFNELGSHLPLEPSPMCWMRPLLGQDLAKAPFRVRRRELVPDCDRVPRLRRRAAPALREAIVGGAAHRPAV